jgi:ABC-type nitrate/sulfonate/bicarbonate transport system permease component
MFPDLTLLWDATIPTLEATAVGLLVSAVSALALALVSTQGRHVKQCVLALALLTATVPVLGYALIADSLLPGNNPLPWLLAAALSFGPITVTTVYALAEASMHAETLLRRGRVSFWRRIAAYDLPYASSAALNGLRIAVPPALLGAMLGEFMGSAKPPGLGNVLVSGLRSGRLPEALLVTTGILVLCAVISALIRALQTAARSWTRLESFEVRITDGAPMRAEASAAAVLGWTLATGLIAWVLVASLRPSWAPIIKTPWEVILFLLRPAFDPGQFSERLATTGTRVLFATALALLLAYTAAALPRSLRLLSSVTATMAFVIQSVPALALFPLVALLVDRGPATGVIVAGLSGFYPIFMTLTERRASLPLTAFAFVHAARSSWWRRERFVFGPWVGPLVITGCRVALPQILSAVLVVEYLVIGDGAGDAIPMFNSRARYPEIWALIVALFAGISFVIFVLQWLERLALRRLGFVST